MIGWAVYAECMTGKENVPKEFQWENLKKEATGHFRFNRSRYELQLIEYRFKPTFRMVALLSISFPRFIEIHTALSEVFIRAGKCKPIFGAHWLYVTYILQFRQSLWCARAVVA